MHYMASQAMYEHDYEHLLDSHLYLQDCMHHPIAVLTEMMGDIMYLHQALCQPDAREFAEAVINIRSRNQGDIDGTSRIVLPCPSS
jgi:hypothetical protein